MIEERGGEGIQKGQYRDVVLYDYFSEEFEIKRHAIVLVDVELNNKAAQARKAFENSAPSHSSKAWTDKPWESLGRTSRYNEAQEI